MDVRSSLTHSPTPAGIEFCERMAYYAISRSIILYIIEEFGFTNGAAAALVDIWVGSAVLSALLGAYLADARLGRFKVVAAAAVTYSMALLGLTLSSAFIPSVQATYWLFLYIIAVSTGSIKACAVAFGADQFLDDEREEAFLPKYFNWYYTIINIGSLIGTAALVNLGLAVNVYLGYAIAAGAFIVVTIVFYIAYAKDVFHMEPPGGSSLTVACKVLAGAIARRKLKADVLEEQRVTAQPSTAEANFDCRRLKEHVSWLDKAAFKTVMPGEGENQQWPCTQEEVEDVKLVFRLLPLLTTFMFYVIGYAQMTSTFILQGQGMDRSLGSVTVSPATLGVVAILTILIFLPVYDVWIAPAFAKLKMPITPLLRLGVGYFFAMASLLVAAGIEYVRLDEVYRLNEQNQNPDFSSETVPLSVWWQTPQYVLMGASEVLVFVGLNELMYSEAPETMRSTCFSLNMLFVALGSYLASLLVFIVQRTTDWLDNINTGHLNYYFFLVAGIMAALLPIHWLVSNNFREKKKRRRRSETRKLSATFYSKKISGSSTGLYL